MGCQQHVLHADKRGIRTRFVREHIYCRAGKMAALHGVFQGIHVHDGAPGGVDEKATRLHFCEGGAVEHTLCFDRQGHAGADKVTFRQELI